MDRDAVKLRLILAAFFAAMLAGPGTAGYPAALYWASWIACPKGTAPADYNLEFYCVAPDGTRYERTLAAMGGLWLLYFMALSHLFAFLPILFRPRAAGVAGESGTDSRESPPV